MIQFGNNQDFARKLVKNRNLSAGLLILFVSIFAVVFFTNTQFDINQATQSLSLLNVKVVILLLLLSLLNFALRSYRWYLFANRSGVRITLIESVKNYIAGFSMGVTPGRLGEVVRIWMLRQKLAVRFYRLAPLLVADRVYDLIAIVFLVIATQRVSGDQLDLSIIAGLVFMMITFYALRFPNFGAAIITTIYKIFGKARKFLAAARRSLHVGKPMFSLSNSLSFGLISVLAWLSECFAFYLLLDSFGTGLSLERVSFIYSFSTLVGAISMLPGGLGGFEATAIFLLTNQGLDSNTAILATTIIRIFTLWFSFLLGSILLTFILVRKRTNEY